MHQARTEQPGRISEFATLCSLWLLLVSGGVAYAQEQFDPAKVIARVGGEVITEAEIGYLLEDMGDEINEIPSAERRKFLVQMLVDMKVMAQAARDAGMADTVVFERRRSHLEDRALRRAYLQEFMRSEISQAEIQAAYDGIFADFKPREQLRARHILVASEDDANAVIAELDQGKDFAELARSMSTGPSGPNGGDLGYFAEGEMVPEFFNAANVLAEGSYSGPVQSQFGWHVIKLEDRRLSEPPPLEQVFPQIRQRVLSGRFEALLEDLKSGAEIEAIDQGVPDGS